MNKIVLSKEDVDLILRWRDEHKALVRSMPDPIKSIEICFAHNTSRIIGIRKGSELTLRIADDFKSLGATTFTILPNGMLKMVKGKYLCSKESFESCLTVYSSLMALMTYGSYRVVDDEPEHQNERKSHHSTKKPHKKQSSGVTYILHKTKNGIYAAPQGGHASPKGIFSVRGHFRHCKSGKVVWIAEYEKGTSKKKKSRTYKLMGERNGEELSEKDT